MSFGYPQIVYTPVSSPITLTFQRGPQDFRCYYDATVHDNVATGGARERVFEHAHMLIQFTLDFMLISDTTDLAAWGAFMTWALVGGLFNFTANSVINEVYHCVLEDKGWEPVRKGPGRYSVQVTLRIVPDGSAPADPGQVLYRFNGFSGSYP